VRKLAISEIFHQLDTVARIKLTGFIHQGINYFGKRVYSIGNGISSLHEEILDNLGGFLGKLGGVAYNNIIRLSPNTAQFKAWPG